MVMITSLFAAFPPGLYSGISDPESPKSLTDIYIIIANVIQIILALVAVVAVIFVIYAGIQYIISSGDPGKTAGARNTITNAVIGVVLSAAAYLVVEFLTSQFT